MGIFDFLLGVMVHFQSVAATNGGQHKEGNHEKVTFD